MGKKKPDQRGKVVVIVLARGPDNTYVRGNMMRTFSFRNRKVSEVARALSKPIERLRRKK